MAITVYPDVLQQRTVSRTKDGYEGLVRTHRVTGLDAPAALREYQAMYAPNIPRYGDWHISGQPNRVGRLTVEFDGPSQALVYIEYVPSKFFEETDLQEPSTLTRPKLSVQTTLQQVTRDWVKQWDPNANNGKGGHKQVRVPIRYAKNADRDAFANPLSLTAAELKKVEEVNGSYTMQVPITKLVYERFEPQDPSLKADQYVGTVNAYPVRYSAPRTWLCTGITGESATSAGRRGTGYTVRYEFQKAPPRETWDTTFMFLFRKSGVTITDYAEPTIIWAPLPNPTNQGDIDYKGKVFGWVPVFGTTQNNSVGDQLYGGVVINQYYFFATVFNNLNLYI